MRDHTIPSEVRLSLYLSARFLQELGLALQLFGVPSVYVWPTLKGRPPRWYVGFAEDELEALEGRMRQPLNSTSSCVPGRSHLMSPFHLYWPGGEG
jgi:hypothetical protein